MQKSTKARGRFLLRCLILISVVLGLVVWVIGGYRLYAYAQYYDKDPETILTQYPGGVEFFGSISMEEAGLLEYSTVLFSGNTEAGEITLPENGDIKMTSKIKAGKVKVMLLNEENQMIFFDELTEKENIIRASPGTYRTYIIGKYLTGKVTVEY